MSDHDEKPDSELARLFGGDTVELARLVDVADLNLDERMISCITGGLTRLKQLRHDPDAQLALVQALEPGERLLLCMWILEMDLLEKIRPV
jgi:hypothetical protein